MSDRRSTLFLMALVSLAIVMFVTCERRVHASPVERIVARVRVLDDARFGHLRLGGVVDGVQYFPGGTLAARRDSANLWIQTDAFPECPPDTACPEPWAFRRIDQNGNGSFEWMARIEAFGFYRADYPADGMRKGQGQPAFFRDPYAYVRVTYTMGELTSLTAWGSERLVVPDSAGYGVDVGQEMVQANDSTFFFTGGLRAGGGRYLVRTTSTWTAPSGRWLGLELTRDTLALQALLP